MGRQGQAPGFVGNPTGKNQYVDAAGQGRKTESFTMLTTPEFKELVRKAAKENKQSMAQWIETAVYGYLDIQKVIKKSK